MAHLQSTLLSSQWHCRHYRDARYCSCNDLQSRDARSECNAGTSLTHPHTRPVRPQPEGGTLAHSVRAGLSGADDTAGLRLESPKPRPPSGPAGGRRGAPYPSTVGRGRLVQLTPQASRPGPVIGVWIPDPYAGPLICPLLRHWWLGKGNWRRTYSIRVCQSGPLAFGVGDRHLSLGIGVVRILGCRWSLYPQLSVCPFVLRL
jgi:hypothetical protein